MSAEGTGREGRSPHPSSASPPSRLRFWGTRGSLPAPGPDTVRFGGNTSCVSMEVDRRHLIFDAGTGIRLLGQRLSAAGPPPRVTIFLTHFHWDHVQGFPFFAPLYDPTAVIEVVGPAQANGGVRELLSAQMAAPHFAVALPDLPARLEFRDLESDGWEGYGVRVRGMRVRHPSNTVGYRIDSAGGAVAYVPDDEVGGDGYPTGPMWRREFLEFLRGCHLLVHDAMFTEEELRDRSGWGHSTFRQAFDLAREAEVAQLQFFHHAPGRSDDELDEVVQRYRLEAERDQLRLLVGAAMEGSEIRFGPEAEG